MDPTIRGWNVIQSHDFIRKCYRNEYSAPGASPPYRIYFLDKPGNFTECVSRLMLELKIHECSDEWKHHLRFGFVVYKSFDEPSASEFAKPAEFFFSECWPLGEGNLVRRICDSTTTWFQGGLASQQRQLVFHGRSTHFLFGFYIGSSDADAFTKWKEEFIQPSLGGWLPQHLLFIQEFKIIAEFVDELDKQVSGICLPSRLVPGFSLLESEDEILEHNQAILDPIKPNEGSSDLPGSSSSSGKAVQVKRKIV